MIKAFRVTAVVEAVSYLCLLAASVARRAFDVQGLVPVVGLAHGVIFLAYFALVVLVRDELGWRLTQTLVVALAAIVPFGGFMVERRLSHPLPAAPPSTGS
jgi:integral membrane protein